MPAPSSPHKLPTTGYLGAFTVLGVPVFIHRSFALSWIMWGVILQLALARFSIEIFVWTSFAVGVVIALHEAGHALAAKCVGAKVHGLVATGAGGLCVFEPPDDVWRRLCILAGGVGAQLLLLAATVLALLRFGAPNTPAATCLVLAFTGINGFIVLINVIPAGSNDGAQLLRVLRQAAA